MYMYVWICVLITTIKISEYIACVNRPRYTHVYAHTHIHMQTNTHLCTHLCTYTEHCKAKYILLL